MGVEFYSRNQVYLIKYNDHVEFRNKDFSELKPMLREVTGWIVEETEDYLLVITEKAATGNPEDIARLKPSGFVILKSDIVEIREIS